MGIDGTDPEELRTVLESEIAAKKAEDKVAAKFMTAMGGYAPTIGIVGCIVGLINVMGSLSDPAALGPMIEGISSGFSRSASQRASASRRPLLVCGYVFTGRTV